MKVELVSISKGAGKLEGKTAQDVISYCARVSNPKNQANFDTASKLLKFCLDEAHWSIFDMATMTLEVTTSMPIAKQILRHKSMYFQEFSGRYAKTEKRQKVKARRQDIKNRQNSIDDLPQDTLDWFEKAQDELWEKSQALYQEALGRGVAKECGRFLLPQFTESTLYVHGTVRSWIHYITTRTHASTQKEHRDIAQEAKKVFCEQFPDVAKALAWTENV
jgi:thymidylate synthase (FAD)